jgi:hypothetical protein
LTKNILAMRIIPIVFILFIGFGVFAQSQETVPATSAAKITFAESSYEFGEIFQGDQVEHIFKYTNTGTDPLILSNVKTTCGCTVPTFSREPLAPGASEQILVKFNSSGKMGQQNKVITITSNAINSTERVSINGNVVVKPAEKTEGQ